MLAVQCRMARAALEWSTGMLAHKAGVAANSVSRFETGAVKCRPEVVKALRTTLENNGIQFIDGSDRAGPGVRFLKPRIEVIRNPGWNDEGFGYVSLLISAQNREFVVVISREILAQIFNASSNKRVAAVAFVDTAKQNISRVLAAVEQVLEDPKRIPADGRIDLKIGDFG